MTLTQNSLNNGARWEVRWLGKKGIVRKQFDEDFAAALEAYYTLKSAGKKLVTLRCCNVGFAPPRHITEHEVVSYQVVRRKGKRYKKAVISHVDLMGQHNERGIYWCPYCIKLWRFKEAVDPWGQPILLCPVCDISNRDWHVKRWNPKVKTIEFRKARRSGRRTRRRRR